MDFWAPIALVIERVSAYAPLHQINIAAHVLFGGSALLVGLFQLLTEKGGSAHHFLGRLFLALFAVVIATASLGSLLFEFRAFLVVLTLLSAYQAISGFRALKIRKEGLKAFDILFALAGLAASAAFIAAVERGDYPWDKKVIYSTLGTLIFVAGYDLLRAVFPRRWFETTWIYEHLFKMIGALSALASAAVGTIYPDFQPFSQLAPSAAGVLLILFFAARVRRIRDADG